MVEPDFGTDTDRPGGADALGTLDAVDGRRTGVADLVVDLLVGVEDLDVDFRVGVADLDVDLGVGVVDLVAGFEAVTVGLAVGVDERAVDLVGVEDLTGAVVGLEEGKVAREVGVEDLEGLVIVVKVGLAVGVAALVPDDIPPDDFGLLLIVMDGFAPDGLDAG